MTSCFDVDYADLIHLGEAEVSEKLRHCFERGLKFLMLRWGVVDADRKIREVFRTAIAAIANGEFRGPEQLSNFVLQIARKSASGPRKNDSMTRNLEPASENRRSSERFNRVIETICEGDREILTRFYCYGETEEQICTKMDLTETELHLRKSAAKSRLVGTLQTVPVGHGGIDGIGRKTMPA